MPTADGQHHGYDPTGLVERSYPQCAECQGREWLPCLSASEQGRTDSLYWMKTLNNIENSVALGLRTVEAVCRA